MRPDQLERLREVEEKLADLFIEEADPDAWAPDGKVRYAQKRSATETAQLLARTQSLMAVVVMPTEPRFAEKVDNEREQMVRAAERKAEEAVARAIDRAKGRKDART